MEFVQLNHQVLKHLELKGFNVLTSNDSITEASPCWYPESVQDLDGYLRILESTPFCEANVLIIQDTLVYIREDELVGVVLMQAAV